MISTTLTMNLKHVESVTARWPGWLRRLLKPMLDHWAERQRVRHCAQLSEEALRRQAWQALHDRLRQRLHARLGKHKR